MKNRFSKSLIFVVISVVLVLSIMAVAKVKTVYAEKSVSKFQYLEMFSDALDIIDRKYVDQVDHKKLIQGAIKGMLNELDPHSAYMDRDVYNSFKDEIKGEFGGLGITIGMRDKMLTVIAPIEDTPAYRAGIKSGDKIIKIDGKSTANISIEDAVSKLRGEPGTSVTVTILRSGEDKPFDVKIVREIIKVKTVKFQKKENIGYIRLTQFNESASSDVMSALKNLKNQNIQGLILDLRNNPGGLLDEAVNVSSIFIPAGKTVVFTRERNEKNTVYLKSRNMPASDYDIPLIVLINSGSASASEIVSGAIQDHKRGLIVGTTSFGKASVQSTFGMDDGSAIKLTIARYYTPSGKSIQGVGITPDLEIKAGEIVYKDNVQELREKDYEKHIIGENEIKDNKGSKDSEDQGKYNKNNDNSTLLDPDRIDFDRDLQLKYAYDFLKGILIHGKKIK